MADAWSFTRLLVTMLPFAALCAAASGPAFAQELAPRLKLHSGELGKLDQPNWAQPAPVIGSLLDHDRAAVAAWTLPLGALEAIGIGGNDRGRRGLTFKIRRSHGFKGMARLRF